MSIADYNKAIDDVVAYLIARGIQIEDAAIEASIGRSTVGHMFRNIYIAETREILKMKLDNKE